MKRTSALARRTIPIAVHVPTQLVLGLPTDHPVEHLHATPEPPVSPMVALRKAVAA